MFAQKSNVGGHSNFTATLVWPGNVLSRYLTISRYPVEARIMAPHGRMLGKLLRHDSYASNIARVIGQIRADFKRQLVVPELARNIGMSTSSLHKYFKTITGTTPVQYQKDLRLIEARRIFLLNGDSVSSAAFEVGYESLTIK